MKLTNEQIKILDSTDDSIIEARAGTGKTTTLIEYSLKNQDKKKLYLAFNKSISEEAKEKFKNRNVKNIVISTAHGLAYRSIVSMKNYKLGFNPSAYYTCKFFKIKTSSYNYKLISHAIKKFELFCNSSVDSMDEIDYFANLNTEAGSKFYSSNQSDIDGYAKDIWEAMDSKAMDCSHSFYLKKYQLSKPKLPYDIIMLDEAQDANPVILDIFFNQTCRKIMVGDNHQAIYSWRGAINALANAPEGFKKFYLTESFRFPQYIADLGLEVLSFKENFDKEFDFSKVKLIGRGLNKPIESKAIISRSNISILKKLIHEKSIYRKPYIEGGLESLTSTNSGVDIYDLYYLKNGMKDEIKNFFIKSFKSIDELQEYYNDLDDPSINSFVQLIKELGSSFLDEMEKLKSRISTKDYCDYTFCTIHKSKGQEWDQVEIISGDMDEAFPTHIPDAIKEIGKNGKPTGEITLSEEDKEILRKQWIEELNIFYVGVTRAKVKLVHSLIWLSQPVINDMKSETEEDEEEDTNLIIKIKDSKNNIYYIDKLDNKVQITLDFDSGRTLKLPELTNEEWIKLSEAVNKAFI